MNESAQPQRAPREWVELVVVSDPNTPVVVRVMTTSTGRPLYSMEIGILRDGRILRHMPIFTQPDSSVAPTDVAALTGMIHRAEEAVAADAARKAAEWQAKQGAREPRGNSERPNRNGKRRHRDDREDRRWR